MPFLRNRCWATMIALSLCYAFLVVTPLAAHESTPPAQPKSLMPDKLHSDMATPDEAVAINHQTITVNPSAIGAEAHSLLDKIARLDDIDLLVIRRPKREPGALPRFEMGAELVVSHSGSDIFCF